MKNKNKSKKVQQYIQQVAKNAEQAGKSREVLKAEELRRVRGEREGNERDGGVGG